MGGFFSKNPTTYLAPLAGVTDRAFREVCRLFFNGTAFTEMVSINALYNGNFKTYEILEAQPDDVCQIFGSSTEVLRAVADSLNAQDVAGFDINCGCPAPKVLSSGGGAVMMRDIASAERFIRTAVEVLNKPISVKFRLGWDSSSINCIDFGRMCEAAGAARVCLHGRTRAQGFGGSADWSYIRKLKNTLKIPVIGNGDIRSVQDARSMVMETGCDGVMIGRAAMGHPWLLGEVERILYESAEGSPSDYTGEFISDCIGMRAVARIGEEPDLSIMSRYEAACLHFDKLLEYKGKRAVLEMRKHASWYMKSVPGAAAVRRQINEASTEAEMRKALEYLKMGEG